MNLAWIVAPAVLLAGSGTVAFAIRRLAAAVQDLGDAQEAMRHLEQGLIPLRVESRRVAGSVDRVWQR